MPGGYFVHNGQLFREGKAVISPDNRSFRYGDGLFETMRIIKGKIPLKDFHFDRLLNGMKLLQFDLPEFFTAANLESDIIALTRKNRMEQGAVIRLVVFRGEGGLYDLENMRPNYIIQSMSLANIPSLNDDEQGIEIDVYPDATKACNIFSSVKSNNFLPYLMGVLYARQRGLGDCLILNQYGRIADATVANIFGVAGKTIYTPPLSEGGVAGVARRFLIENLPHEGYEVQEKPIAVEELQQLDEVFLTNAVRGVRLVKKFGDRIYASEVTKAVQKMWQTKTA